MKQRKAAGAQEEVQQWRVRPSRQSLWFGAPCTGQRVRQPGLPRIHRYRGGRRVAATNRALVNGCGHDAKRQLPVWIMHQFLLMI